MKHWRAAAVLLSRKHCSGCLFTVWDERKYFVSQYISDFPKTLGENEEKRFYLFPGLPSWTFSSVLMLPFPTKVIHFVKYFQVYKWKMLHSCNIASSFCRWIQLLVFIVICPTPETTNPNLIQKSSSFWYLKSTW